MKKEVISAICISFTMILSAGCGDISQDNDLKNFNNTSSSYYSDYSETSTVFQSSETYSVESLAITETDDIYINTEKSPDIVKPADLVTYYSPDALPDFLKQIEWTDDMVVNTDEERDAYINKCVSEFRTEIAFILSGSCSDLDENSVIGVENGILATHCQQVELGYGEVRTTYVVYSVGYFTSAYILDAYRTGDTSRLDDDNLAVYNKSLEFINTLDKNSSDLVREKQIHDYICDMTTYYNSDEDYTPENLPRYRMALGVMLDGSANCMGYTDTFYMLASMAGFEVNKVGSEESMKHTWNVITLNGKKYVVDVTWNDDAMLMNDGQRINNYIYFNAPLDVISQEYRYDVSNEHMQSVVPTADENYFYSVNNFDFGYMTYTYDEFYNKAKQLIDSGQTTFYIACKNTVAGDTNDMANKIFDRLGAGGHLVGSLNNISGYSFAYIHYSAG